MVVLKTKKFIICLLLIMGLRFKNVSASVVTLHSTDASHAWFVASILFSLLLSFVVAALIFYVIWVKRENENSKMSDAETGIGNLQFFKYNFKTLVSDDFKTRYYIAYIALNISYLRSYHDENAFEDLLRYTSSVLLDNTRDGEFVARISENGFAFVINAEGGSKRLEKIMNELNKFVNDGKTDRAPAFHCAAYQLLPSDKNSEILLFNLKRNCNRVFGTNKQIVYCDIDSMNAVMTEKQATELILKGLDNNEFKMYLQFIVNNKTKKIESAEALSRWDRGKNGVDAPGKYIANMESTGLISRHDLYIFENACRQLEKWSATEFKDISISCNFTRITLSEDDFIDSIIKISNKYSFDKSKLSIEITEDAIEKNSETAILNVKKCKELGFNVYLDDLGSGYTALANLCDYPIDIVKLDRDILLKTNEKRGRDLFKGVIALAHSLGIEIICEGVETEEQNELVSGTECDYIQGWYYSKPLPLEESEAFVKQYSVGFESSLQ